MIDATGDEENRVWCSHHGDRRFVIVSGRTLCFRPNLSPLPVSNNQCNCELTLTNAFVPLHRRHIHYSRFAIKRGNYGCRLIAVNATINAEYINGD